MFYSEKYQLQWGLPPRTASRLTRKFIEKLGFKELFGHHVVVNIRNEWPMVLNVRNPYSIMVSWWLREISKKPLDFYEVSFEDYIKRLLNKRNEYNNKNIEYGSTHTLKIFDRKPDIFIRYETLGQDLMNLQVIKDNLYDLTEEIQLLNEGHKPWTSDYIIDSNKPYHEYYNPEIASLVYELREEEFLIFGYDRDSWNKIIR